MKKIFLATALFASISAFAQTEKGDWMLGGTVGFRTNKDNNQLNISPNAGYFFANNFAAGANLQMDFTKVGESKTTDLGIGPFARYYFEGATVRPFVTTSFNYLYTKSKSAAYKNSESGFGWFFGVGAAAFINQNVALETIAGYNYSKYGSQGYSGFALNIGFQVYINKGKMDNYRKGKIQE